MFQIFAPIRSRLECNSLREVECNLTFYGDLDFDPVMKPNPSIIRSLCRLEISPDRINRIVNLLNNTVMAFLNDCASCGDISCFKCKDCKSVIISDCRLRNVALASVEVLVVGP